MPSLSDRIKAEKEGKPYTPENDLPGMGGVFNGLNLGSYSYAHLNPVKFIDPDGNRADIYVTIRQDKGFDFKLVDDKGSKPVTGSFNVNTTNYNQLRPGSYTVKPRPKVSEPGILGKIADLFKGTTDRNKNVGNPTISNTDDWNTISYAGEEPITGAQIHPGRNGTDEGNSLACMVTDKGTFDKIKNVLEKNYDDGGVFMYIKEPSE